MQARKFVFTVFLALAANAAALEVPVGNLDGWTSLTFNKIPANEVGVDAGHLSISVRRSASPLVFKLQKPTAVSRVTVRARWTGALNLPAGAVQGDKGVDDFVLKLGVVEAGERTLSWLQRKVAADWIKQLFRLAPKGSGVERINFLSTTQQAELVGSEREHPLSDLLYETRLTKLDGPGEFTLDHEFAEPVTVLGLWISSDGDDTGSSFDVEIESITLHTD